MNKTHMPHCTFSYKNALIDSAATDHHTQPSAPLTELKPVLNAQPVYLTNGESIKASRKGVLPNLPMLDSTTKTTQICKNINSISLTSLGKLCDGGCEAKLTNKMWTVSKNKNPIMKAPRCKTTEIYFMEITKKIPNVKLKHQPAMANSSLARRQSKVVNVQNFITLERLKFYHSSLWDTPLRTLKQAINAGYLKY